MMKVFFRLLAALLLVPLAIFLYCWVMYFLTLQIAFASGLEAPTPAGRHFALFMRVVSLTLPLCGVLWITIRRAKHKSMTHNAEASEPSAGPRPWSEWLVQAAVWVFLATPVAFVTLYLLMFTAWPLFRLSQVTEETHLTFPRSAHLEGAYFVWAGVEAKVRMPREALGAFLHQPIVKPTVLARQKVDGRVLAEWDFAFHGWDVGDTRHLKYHAFAGGDATCWLLVDPDDTPEATVYIYTDDP